MERQSIRKFFSLMCAVVFFISSFAIPASSADKPIKWRMANLYPRGIAYGPVYQEFCDAVNRMSGGRLMIDAIYDGEGVNATEVWSAVKSGIVEMGAPYMALHAGEFPAGVVGIGLPGGPSETGELMALWHEGGWLDIMNKATEKHGIYCLTEAMQPGTYLLTKKPINNLDDLKNMKIRAPGAYGKMLRQLGASPVVIAFAEVYTSLATGVVDGVDGCNLVDHRDGKFYEVAKYMYPLPLTGAQVSPLIVNLKAYNSLPDDLKEILKAASYYHGFLSAYKSVVWEKEALQEMINKGLKMSPPPSEADKKKWQEAGIAIWPEYEAADATSKQMIEAQRVFMKKMGK